MSVSTTIAARAVYGAQSAVQDVEELRKSHAVLLRHLARLEGEIRDTRTLFSYERLSPFHSNATFEVRSLRRLIMFANLNAVQSLTTGSFELSQLRHALCPGNSVKQIYLRSQTTQCTLFEFQLLASEVSRRASIRCSVFPSEFYVSFPSIEKATRFEIIFETYFDLCQALEIDVCQREAGLYREKRGVSRTVRAIQVLGVEISCRGTASEHGRKILVGSSLPDQAKDRSDIPMLYQDTTSWSEGTYESGFVFQKESSDTVLRDMELPLYGQGDHPEQNSDLNMPVRERKKFSIAWERTLKAPGVPARSAEFVPGAIRSFMPAVILRSRILTTTTQKIFSSRIQGKFLRQIVVSPPQK